MGRTHGRLPSWRNGNLTTGRATLSTWRRKEQAAKDETANMAEPVVEPPQPNAPVQSISANSAISDDVLALAIAANKRDLLEAVYWRLTEQQKRMGVLLG